MKLCIQFEVAYLKRGQKRMGEYIPPDGYLFMPCYYELGNKPNADEIIGLLREQLIRIDYESDDEF